MTFTQFKYLSSVNQEYLLSKRGIEIARTRDECYHYILFQIDGFYIEVKYVMPGATIIHVACFEDINLVDPYLENIKIDSLFAL